ncbi:hypothetical protein Poli38472_002147 [Pythium oligandrum]|uniref:Protein HGH1 homolog n=1 Tax=Pythium oligandrum TaxID=41045 RepID=A0A8K1CI53_PYTOL|nr:hypothetical protein Poli38472_002147 [Pythium oligandrum]|eukprot:TMW63206.1 hypothetical protein Poli38472_002147 [Pythium oligandrum]
MADTKTLEDLVGFLSSPRPELRKSASSMLVNLSASDQAVYQLLHLQKNDVIQGLCRVVSDLRPIAEDAIKALINLTAIHPDASERTIKFDLLNRVMTQLEDDEWRLKNLSMMLLANVTTTEAGARALIGADTQAGAATAAYREKKIRTLTVSFMESEPEPDGVDADSGEAKWDDEYQYVAVILGNISQLEEGRQFILKVRNGKTLIEALLPQLRSPNLVRRRGITALIKNLCFDTDSHFLLYDHLDIPSKLMYLLAGPEPLDPEEKIGMHPDVYKLGPKKKREHDRFVRLACVDALLLLGTSRNGRNNLRQKKVYPIIRNAHLVEPDEEIGDQIYKLVDFLIRDEEGEEPDWDKIRTEAFSDDKPSPAPAKEEEKQEEVAAKTETAAAKPKSPKAAPAPTEEPKESVEEEVSDELAASLALEIANLDVSSDEEDDVELD